MKHFLCLSAKYKPFQRLPKQFAMANCLINKKCGLIIRDERQRSWNLRIYTYNSVVHISGGWVEFCNANDLKEGDYVVFEVVANGEKPIWKFHGKFSHFSNLFFVKDLFTLLYTPCRRGRTHLPR